MKKLSGGETTEKYSDGSCFYFCVEQDLNIVGKFTYKLDLLIKMNEYRMRANHRLIRLRMKAGYRQSCKEFDKDIANFVRKSTRTCQSQGNEFKFYYQQIRLDEASFIDFMCVTINPTVRSFYVLPCRLRETRWKEAAIVRRRRYK